MNMNLPTVFRRLLIAIPLLTPFAVSVIPLAYADDDKDGQTRKLEEVMVTATKRANMDILQRVPIAATVFTDAMIAENNFTDLLEVGSMVPGASFRETATYPGTQRFWMRGTGTNFSTPNFDPAVAVYQDGVFIAQNIAAILDTFDMESI
jgi:iron complex outermembrane receptor protein